MIDPPKRQDDYPDRPFDCEAALEPMLQGLIAAGRAHGWGPHETRKALLRLIAADRRKDGENAATEAYLALIRAMEGWGRAPANRSGRHWPSQSSIASAFER